MHQYRIIILNNLPFQNPQLLCSILYSRNIVLVCHCVIDGHLVLFKKLKFEEEFQRALILK